VNRLPLLVGFLVLLFAMIAGAAVAWHYLERRSHLAARLTRIRYVGTTVSRTAEQRYASSVADLVAYIGTGIARSGLLSQKTMMGLEHTLASTGFHGSSALGLFVGTKLLLLFANPLLALIVLDHLGWSSLLRNIGVAAAALAGLLGPDWWVNWRHKKYLRAVTAGLPDALDLMVICAEAGLSFEPAIIRVANEIRSAHPAISQEFSLTASELRVAADSKIALTNMGTRTGLESVKRITSVLTQTMRYGTPLGDALRVLSAEMRHEMLIRFETRAARLPVLMTIPMILFILPCIFLIVGGPAAVQVVQSLFH
jgi:tight adherence protein C